MEEKLERMAQELKMREREVVMARERLTGNGVMVVEGRDESVDDVSCGSLLCCSRDAYS
jgi:hypothetical protein